MKALSAAYFTELQRSFACFLEHLKTSGLPVDIQTGLLAQQLYASSGFSDPLSLQHSLRTLICKNRQQWRSFNQLYRDYWLRKPSQLLRQNPQRIQPDKPQSITGNKKGTARSKQQLAPGSNDDTTPGAEIGRASVCQVQENIDFSFLDNRQTLAKFSISCRELIKALHRVWRKTEKSAGPDSLDFRQSIEDNRKHGGTLLQLAWRKKRPQLPQITLLIDVSRSMSNYANALLIFALALVRELPKSQVYIFNTRLVDISAALKRNQQPQIEAQLNLLNTGWGSGTRIAHSLSQLPKNAFGHKKSSRHLIIHSDGLDTDPPQALSAELQRLKKQYRQIIWLSPLMRHQNYQVETAALKMALKSIDHLLPSYDSDCLQRLAQRLLNPKF